jgi:hypothetical protein
MAAAISGVGTLIAAIVAGVIGARLTWRQMRSNEIAQEGQITDRFSQAIEQLGATNLEVRLGGIYALERVARDSERDHWPIMEIFTAYIREHAPWPPKTFHHQLIFYHQ